MSDSTGNNSQLDGTDLLEEDEEWTTTDDEVLPGGNVRVIGVLSPRRVINESDFIEAFNIDPEEWVILFEKPNKWDGFYRSKRLDAPVVVEMYQLKATMVRKQVVPVEYTVQPVRISADGGNAASKDALDYEYKKTLSFFDPQFGFRRNIRTGELDPFHDRRALSVVLQVANEEQPDCIIVGGDLMDFSEFTDKFIKEPGFFFVTQFGLEETFWWLAQLRKACPNARIIVLKGNHDKRLEDIMATHLVHASGLSVAGSGITAPPVMSLPYLLDFDGLGIEYVDSYPNGSTIIGGVEYIHGDTARAQPGATASKIISGSTRDTGFGHTHRRESVSANLPSGIAIQAFSPGCMCRIDYTVPGHKRDQNWQQGFAMVYHSRKANEIHMHPINNGEAMVNGRYYRYKSIIAQLRKDTGWKF